MLLKGCLLFLLLVPASHYLLAQDSTSGRFDRPDRRSEKKERLTRLMKMEEEGDLVYYKHGVFGIKLASDGYGLFYERGTFKTTTRSSIWQVELNEKKNPKDHKTSTIAANSTFSSVAVGKLNNFYQLKGSFGEQRLIGGKGNKNGVVVSGIYTGGVSIGFLKPYYVDVEFQDNSSGRRTYPTVLDSMYRVDGGSGVFVGFDKLSIKPGLNAKAALRFDYGRFNQSITAIEAGISGEYFFSKIPMFMDQPQKNFFFSGYIAIMFGRRK